MADDLPEAGITDEDGSALAVLDDDGQTPGGGVVESCAEEKCGPCEGGCQCGCCEIPGNKCTFKMVAPECKQLAWAVRLTGSGTIGWKWTGQEFYYCDIATLGEWGVGGSVGPIEDSGLASVNCAQCVGCVEGNTGQPYEDGGLQLWAAVAQFCWSGPLKLNAPGSVFFLFTNIPQQGVDEPGQFASGYAEYRAVGMKFSTPPRVRCWFWHNITSGATYWAVEVVTCKVNPNSGGQGALAAFDIIRNVKGCPVGFKARWSAQTHTNYPNGGEFGTVDADVTLVVDWTKGPLGCGGDGLHPVVGAPGANPPGNPGQPGNVMGGPRAGECLRCGAGLVGNRCGGCGQCFGCGD